MDCVQNEELSPVSSNLNMMCDGRLENSTNHERAAVCWRLQWPGNRSHYMGVAQPWWAGRMAWAPLWCHWIWPLWSVHGPTCWATWSSPSSTAMSNAASSFERPGLASRYETLPQVVSTMIVGNEKTDKWVALNMEWSCQVVNGQRLISGTGGMWLLDYPQYGIADVAEVVHSFWVFILI